MGWKIENDTNGEYFHANIFDSMQKKYIYSLVSF